ncbi:penicillin-binding protein 2 [Nocardioides sp. JQ2195]|uniref:penicillin-binding protein 2 n=1 Tax=Nocardioides sp. JQ2195 TaxID=2592334 RepID=UPI00143ED19C|nr:penicillin-binding protein 2 [Nocardioides sp. JQ2195]QIX26078.1 penicillin-binding protein 2 [Nocardioides sp. JQ2195]
MALSTQQRSRLRLVVVQALVLSLFATLFARLWYLQVAAGEIYQAKAASQSIREIVLQPDRGLIVDAQGRPLVANRSSWVISVDRTTLGKLSDGKQRKLLHRVARAVDMEPRAIRARLLNCGDADAVARKCWNGSPYQPVPIATDVRTKVALLIKEQAEDYPGVLAQQESVRAYPQPYGVNAAHLLGYLSPITEGELAEAESADDVSVNGASQVGRAGVEKEYDRYLRGMPGYQRVEVNSMGQVMKEHSLDAGTPGDTLVTSIDAKVQATVEKQLAETIATARKTYDTVTHKNYVADSGAAVVMEVNSGRIVAMASQPTYDPSVWVNGITQAQLSRLYSEQAGTPLLSRATQGQFAPGSTWKPMMTIGALTNGYTTETRLNCSSAFQVGNRAFKNYESGAYGFIGFDKALEVSCNTFFYRVGYDFWRRYGSDVADVNAKDPLVEEAEEFGFGETTGIDLPAEASGRIADRAWKRGYYDAQKDYYCKLAKNPPKDASDFLRRFAHEFCVEGYAYRAGDAVNFAIGQGDTIVTPLQLARAYAAIGNGGTLWKPRIGKAVVDADGKLVKRIEPEKQGTVDLPDSVQGYVDTALKGVTRQGTMSWRMGGFPLDQVQIRSKTGSAEVYGKQSTSWVASYSDDYVVIMMVSQGGTGSGTSGPAVRKIWETLYGIEGEQVMPARSAIPDVLAGTKLPVFAEDGSILPPKQARH